jgi:hypothetical protein
MSTTLFPSTKNVLVGTQNDWTDERRARAIPLPSPIRELPKGEVLDPMSAPAAPGAPTKIAGATYAGWPYDAVGKVYFTKSDGKDYVATGWMMAFDDPAGRMPMIMTAAHVLWDLDLKTWAKDVHIVIGQGGTTTVAVWPTALQVTSAWQQQANYAAGVPYDYACCYVDRTSWTGQVLPIQWNLNNTATSMHAVGYPAQANHGYPFEGNAQWDQAGDMYGTARPASGDGSLDMASWLAPGASGGPWIGYGTDGKRWVQGLQSGWYGADSGRCITAYFGSTFAGLMSWAKQEWPKHAQ